MAGTAIQLMAGYAYLQEYKRNIDRSVREIEREKTKLQQQVAMLACVHALGHTPLVGTRTMHTRMRAHL